jgi:hypothetical protein
MITNPTSIDAITNRAIGSAFSNAQLSRSGLAIIIHLTLLQSPVGVEFEVDHDLPQQTTAGLLHILRVDWSIHCACRRLVRLDHMDLNGAI